MTMGTYTPHTPISWEKFASKWASYFKPITDYDGTEEWQEFVSKVYSERMLLETVEELAKDYAAQRRNNPSMARQPKLMDLKTLFFQRAKEKRSAYQQSDAGAATACPLCRGSQKVLCLIDGTSDEYGRWGIIVPEEYHGGYYATAVYDCPKCSNNRLNYARERAELIERASVPDCLNILELMARFPQRGE